MTDPSNSTTRPIDIANRLETRADFHIRVTSETLFVHVAPELFPVGGNQPAPTPASCGCHGGDGCHGDGGCSDGGCDGGCAEGKPCGGRPKACACGYEDDEGDDDGVQLLHYAPGADGEESNILVRLKPGRVFRLELDDHDLVAWTGPKGLTEHTRIVGENFAYQLRYRIRAIDGDEAPSVGVEPLPGGERLFRIKNNLSLPIIVGTTVTGERLKLTLAKAPQRRPEGFGMNFTMGQFAVIEDDPEEPCRGVQEISFEKLGPDAPDKLRVVQPDGYFTVFLKPAELANWHKCTGLVEFLTVHGDALDVDCDLTVATDENGVIEPTTLLIGPDANSLC